MELALENERARRAEGRIEIKAAGEVRREIREESLSLISLGIDPGGQLAEPGGRIGGQEERLLAGGIMKRHSRVTGAIRRRERDRLLVQDRDAGLTANGGSAATGDSEGFSKGNGGNIPRPDRAVNDGERGRVGGIPGTLKSTARLGTQIRNDGAGGRRRSAIGPGESVLRLVVKTHGKRVGARRGLRQLRGTAGEPIENQGILGALGIVERETDLDLGTVGVGNVQQVGAAGSRVPNAVEGQPICQGAEGDAIGQRSLCRD